MKIAVIGANEAGILVAAKLQSANLDVALFKVHPETSLQQLNDRVELYGMDSLQPSSIKLQTIEESKQLYDFIFLFSKPHFNNSLLPTIKKNLKKSTIIVSFQESLNDDVLTKILSPNLVITGVTHFQSFFKSNDKLMLTTDFKEFINHAFDLSYTDESILEDLFEVKTILDYVGQTKIISDHKNIRWTNALFLIAIDRLASALNCRYGDIHYHQTALSTSVHLADEITRTARKQQITLANSYSFDFNEFIIDSDVKYEQLMPNIKSIIQIHSMSQSSFYYSPLIKTDLIDEIIHFAQLNDQPTPYLELLRDCLRYRRLAPFHENIQKFAPLVDGTAT